MEPHPSIETLFAGLAGLLILAAFFAGSETALMSSACVTMRMLGIVVRGSRKRCSRSPTGSSV